MKTGRDIILEYCKTFKSNSISLLSACQDVKLSLTNEKFADYLYDYCPSSFGIYYIGLCEKHTSIKLTNLEQTKECKECWRIALEKKFDD